MRKPIVRIKIRKREQGYILLTILLWVSLLTITVSLPMLTYYHQQMKRDQEEELVHRGVEYERAIRKYYRKFGSYPATVEMLEDSNHMRFLRKRYKDPITGKDFKVLHQVDVMMAFGNAIGGGGIAGGQNLGQPVGEHERAADACGHDRQQRESFGLLGNRDSSGRSGATEWLVQFNSTLPFASIFGPAGGQPDDGRGRHRRCGQREHRSEHSRLQQKRSLQRLAVRL